VKVAVGSAGNRYVSSSSASFSFFCSSPLIGSIALSMTEVAEDGTVDESAAAGTVTCAMTFSLRLFAWFGRLRHQ